MARFHNGVICIPLLTPMYVHHDVIAHRACLDAVLAGQLFERTGDGPGALVEIRELLDHWTVDGTTAIPKCSQVILQAPILSQRDSIICRSIFRTVNDPQLRQFIGNVKWENSFDTLQRPFKYAMLNRYREIEVTALWYLFRGDIERIEAAFQRVGRVGALRAKGGGEIDGSRVRAEAVPTTSEMFGVICRDRLMRPVPTRCTAALRRHSDVQYLSGSFENWQAPYHQRTSKEDCLAPIQVGPFMVMEVKEIASLVQ